MNTVDLLLSRIQRVRCHGGQRWSASCPGPLHARGDRSAGLSIRQLDDRVLIYCHAGCSAAEVLAAVGLSLSDLFEHPLTTTSVGSVREPPFPRAMAVNLFKAATVLLLAADQLRFKKPLNDADFESLKRAYAEIDAVVTQSATWSKWVMQ